MDASEWGRGLLEVFLQAAPALVAWLILHTVRTAAANRANRLAARGARLERENTQLKRENAELRQQIASGAADRDDQAITTLMHGGKMDEEIRALLTDLDCFLKGRGWTYDFLAILDEGERKAHEAESENLAIQHRGWRKAREAEVQSLKSITRHLEQAHKEALAWARSESAIKLSEAEVQQAIEEEQRIAETLATVRIRLGSMCTLYNALAEELWQMDHWLEE